MEAKRAAVQDTVFGTEEQDTVFGTAVQDTVFRTEEQDTAFGTAIRLYSVTLCYKPNFTLLF